MGSILVVVTLLVFLCAPAWQSLRVAVEASSAIKSSISPEHPSARPITEFNNLRPTRDTRQQHANNNMEPSLDAPSGTPTDGEQHPIRHSRGFGQFIKLNFRRAGIEDILDKNQPSLHGTRLAKGGASRAGSDKGGSRRGRRNRRTHPRMLHFSRLDEFRDVWCQKDTATIKVRARGCRSQEVATSFCYGKCASIFIPRYEAGGRLLQTFRSCGYCRGATWKLRSVQLYCPSRTPAYKVKKIAMVDTCVCTDIYKDEL